MKKAAKTRVFIAGSRRLSRLSPDVRRRIDTIVDNGLTVIIGDANGIDKAVQVYLKDRHAQNVQVFCMEGDCRNNIGGWPTRAIKAADPEHRDFSYYSTKDRAMAAEADYALMLWDEESRGTLRNISDLVQRGKPVVVYLAHQKTFQALHRQDDLQKMLSEINTSVFHDSHGSPPATTSRNGGRRKTQAGRLF